MDDAIVSAEMLSFSYELPALIEFDLSVARQSICVLVGLNGAGKSTALKLLSGQLRPSAGRCRILGRNPREARARRGLFYIPEVSDPPGHLSAGELVRFFLDLYSRDGDRALIVRNVLERVGLPSVSRKRPTTFSKGMRRRLELACLLAVDPEVWILDEPQAGLDPNGLALLRELCLEAKERGRAVIMATHALADVEILGDQVLVLERGRVRFRGDRAALRLEVGARAFVVRGAPEGDDALLSAAVRAGASIEGPSLPIQALERYLFGNDDR